MAFAFGDVLGESTECEKKLLDAFANRDMTSGFLPLAEEALLKYPGDGYILILAATAALLDGHPERALVFLKRYSKRYVPNAANHLLHALRAGTAEQECHGACGPRAPWIDLSI
jgi:hypothetical protein